MDLVQAIIVQAAMVFGQTPAEILSRSRKQPIAEARQAAMWAVRQRYPSIPLATIGAAIGNRHYTTVMHALAAAEERACQDAAYRARLENLLARIAAPALLVTEPQGVPHYGALWWCLPETHVSQP